MKRRTRVFSCLLFACVAVSPLFIKSAARAEPSCTWAQQDDGSQFGTCVGDDGKQFCVSCPSGTTASPTCTSVSCK